MAYDADCGPCAKFKQVVAILDIRRKVDFVPLDIADASGLLDAVPRNLRYRSFHIVLPDRKVLSGANALPELISLFPAGPVFSMMMTGAPGGKGTMTFVYLVFARLHNLQSCKYKQSPAWLGKVRQTLATKFGRSSHLQPLQVNAL